MAIRKCYDMTVLYHIPDLPELHVHVSISVSADLGCEMKTIF